MYNLLIMVAKSSVHHGLFCTLIHWQFLSIGQMTAHIDAGYLFIWYRGCEMLCACYMIVYELETESWAVIISELSFTVFKNEFSRK